MTDSAICCASEAAQGATDRAMAGIRGAPMLNVDHAILNGNSIYYHKKKSTNIAMHGIAAQIDDYDTEGERGAHKAIDGGKGGTWTWKSISQTSTGGSDAWWKVTFLKW